MHISESLPTRALFLLFFIFLTFGSQCGEIFFSLATLLTITLTLSSHPLLSLSAFSSNCFPNHSLHFSHFLLCILFLHLRLSLSPSPTWIPNHFLHRGVSPTHTIQIHLPVHLGLAQRITFRHAS
ncbi:hypothetical protein IE53DRAFT_101340 [Violaceomyces palustris]|uniref:Uncharacterized protein n=1 Tax=Violaceomyces palustris TaxID=1673888 RepID=A0ACD0NWY9_9BASI|nr:hypothetical protein IE53DRAFT_101340 [Violaceomyces palustris]